MRLGRIRPSLNVAIRGSEGLGKLETQKTRSMAGLSEQVAVGKILNMANTLCQPCGKINRPSTYFFFQFKAMYSMVRELSVHLAPFLSNR